MGPTVELSGALTPGTSVPGGVSSQQKGRVEGQEREGKDQPAWGWGCLRPKPGNVSLPQQSSGSKVQACHSPEGKTEAAAAVAAPALPPDSDSSRHCLSSERPRAGVAVRTILLLPGHRTSATEVARGSLLFVKFGK